MVSYVGLMWSLHILNMSLIFAWYMAKLDIYIYIKKSCYEVTWIMCSNHSNHSRFCS